MNDVQVIPTAECYMDGLHAAVDVVARERRFIGVVQGPSLEGTRTYIRAMLGGGGIQMLAVTAEDVVVGWCDVVRNTHEGFQHIGRLWMGLIPEYRGRGLGKQLALQAIHAAWHAGIERVELEVFASNERAIFLYRKLGFVTEGVKRRARCLDGQYDDKVLMALLHEPHKSGAAG